MQMKQFWVWSAAGQNFAILHLSQPVGQPDLTVLAVNCQGPINNCPWHNEGWRGTLYVADTQQAISGWALSSGPHKGGHLAWGLTFSMLSISGGFAASLCRNDGCGCVIVTLYS